MPGKFFNPFPKYLQIRDILLRRLEQDLAPGARFPTEHALCGEFGVSRETVREALRGLEADGLIARRRGQGTVVVRRPGTKREARLTGLVENFTELKRDTSARVLDQRPMPAPVAIASALGVPAGEHVFLIQRLRVLDGEPLVVHEAYLPIEIGARLSRLDLRKTTISHELTDTLGIEIREEYQEFDAAVADPDRAALLQVPVGAPLLVVRRLYLGGDGRPVVFFRSCFRSDRYFYTVKMPNARRDPPAVSAAPVARRPSAKRRGAVAKAMI